MSTIRTRCRLKETKRAALFEHRGYGEYAQSEVGVTVKFSQVSRDGTVAPAGDVTLVFGAAEARLFTEAPIGAEFDLVISPAKAE